LGLPDLATGTEYVRQRIIHFLNNLIKIGVAGFRIDAAKHIWPADIDFIVGQLNNLREECGFRVFFFTKLRKFLNFSIFGKDKRPFIYQEVIDLGFEPIRNQEYNHIGRVTEFKYGFMIANVIKILFFNFFINSLCRSLENMMGNCSSI
jgi:alpha-amylase